MSPNQASSASPQLATSTTTSTSSSSSATLASLLIAALDDVEKLKVQVETLTKRAVSAENLLRSLAVEDASPTNTNTTATTSTSTSNNNPITTNAGDSKSGITAPPHSLTPAALSALMAAEARATAAEARLAAILDSWSELLRLDDRAADERRRFEDKVTDERRRLIASVEDRAPTPSHASFGGGGGRRSPPTHSSSSYALLRTESAPLTFSSSLPSNRIVPPLRSFTHHTPFTLQVNGIGAQSTSSHGSALLQPSLSSSSSSHPTHNHSRVRPRTGSDAAGSSQPPTKRIRAGSASSSQLQQSTQSYYHITHTNPSSRTSSPYSYQQQQNQNTSRSHLHPSHTTYSNPTAAKGRVSHSPSTVGVTGRLRSHQQQQQQQQHYVQKGHPNDNNPRYMDVGDRDSEAGDVAMGGGLIDENGRGYPSGGDVNGAVLHSHSAREGGTPDHLVHPHHVHHHRDAQQYRNARDRGIVSDLDNELGGIIDDATPHHPHRRNTRDDTSEQDPSNALVDELLDDPSHHYQLSSSSHHHQHQQHQHQHHHHRVISSHPPPAEYEILPHEEEVDAEGEEDELSNASIDDLLLEVAGGPGPAGAAGGGGGGPGGPGGGVRERSDPGVGGTAVTPGGKPVKTRSNAHVKAGSVSATRPQATGAAAAAPRSKQPLKQHLSTASSALGGNSISSILPQSQSGSQQLSPVGAGSGGLTSSNSLTGLAPSLSAQHLFKAAGLPPGGYPAVNAQGERTCRQCGQPGRYKDGKCVEKWGPGPAGPGTVCDRCRKKMKRVERRGDANATMLAQAQAQARAEAQQIQAQALVAQGSSGGGAPHSQNGSLSAQNSLVSVAGGGGDSGRGEKGNSINNNGARSIGGSRSPRVSPSRSSDKDKEQEMEKEESGGPGGSSASASVAAVVPPTTTIVGSGGGSDASTDMSNDEFMNPKSLM